VEEPAIFEGACGSVFKMALDDEFVECKYFVENEVDMTVSHSLSA
jgi:hypothetical protein